MGGLDGTVVWQYGSNVGWSLTFVGASDLWCEEVSSGSGVGDDGGLWAGTRIVGIRY